MKDATHGAEKARSATPHAAVATCVLCSSSETRIVEQFSVADILKLWKALGASFSEVAQESFGQVSHIALLECLQCGFRVFDPQMPGNAAFYMELQKQMKYYAEGRFEFDAAISFARDHGIQSVLDIGCGTGSFLNLARKAGLKTYGVELNPEAAQACRQNGHEVFSCLINDLAKETAQRFDFVVAFQVLEHVPNPTEFFRDAKKLVKPGGYLGIAVPNNGGVQRLYRFDPHQMPPHHLSHWRTKDLHCLGKVCDCAVIDSAGDRLYGGEIETFWKLQNSLAAVLGRKKLPGGHTLPRILSLLYRKTGCKYFFPKWGTNIYAFYQLRH